MDSVNGFSFMTSPLGPEVPEPPRWTGAGAWVGGEDSTKKLQSGMGQPGASSPSPKGPGPVWGYMWGCWGLAATLCPESEWQAMVFREEGAGK